jgi:hypothetical protein
MREAGLPPLIPDVQGERSLVAGSKGVVRAVYPDRWRVDLEADDGSLLTEVVVLGPYFPEIHKDGEAPAHVGYMHVRGGPEAFCWPLPHRRLLGPEDTPTSATSQDQPERRFFHLHGYILRFGDVTVRLTRDNRYVIETEQGDYIILDTDQRQIRLHAPTVFLGTDEQANRVEYEQDESIRAFNPLILLGTEAGDRIEYVDQSHVQVVTPQCVIGQTGQPDADGITYLANSMIHLVSQVIKFTAATAITLDPPRLNFGNANANERLMLGNAFMTLYNAFIALFNTHGHTNVQNGGGTSGPPATGAASMTTAQLSDIAFVSKTGL